MLRILLDEHVSPAVAVQLVARNPDIIALALRSWDDGAHLGEADPVLLAAAKVQELTLVTYDQRTLPPLLKAWAEQGIRHGGVVFVDTHSFAPADIGGLVEALEQLWRSRGREAWGDRVAFLSNWM